MEYINIVLNYLKIVVVSTLFQIMAIFGFLFLFGILLYFISRSTRKAFVNSYHEDLDVYLTGWIGTPVHESGHAVFCLLFGHRIRAIKFFNPNSVDGTLGYVDHSYNPNSFFQLIGNFFIGAGPVIFGSFVLYALMYYLLPNYREIANLMSNNVSSHIGFFELFKNSGSMLLFGLDLSKKVFAVSNFGSITFWIFIYLSLCVSSHIQLSPADLNGMWYGFGAIVSIFLGINLLTTLFGIDITDLIVRISRYTGEVTGLFILAILISIGNFVLSYALLAVMHYRKYKKVLSII